MLLLCLYSMFVTWLTLLILQVNEISQDPTESEDDSVGLDGISEEDLNALLDATSAIT